MVERVDSVHIKIKIDVDEESKAFAENLSSGMARADEQQVKKQSEIKEKPKQKKQKIKSKEEFIGPPTLEEYKKKLEEEQKDRLLKQEKLEKKLEEKIEEKHEFIGPPTLEEYEKKLDEEWAERIKQEELKEKTKEALEKKGVGYASKGLDIVNTPERLLMLGMRYLPHTALIALAVSLAPFVFNYLTKPGGDLDLRLKIYLKDEFNAFLSRQTQKDTEMGVRQVIIQSKIGFTAANGVNNYNTLRGIREGGINPERIDRIGMVDHAKGLF